MYSLKNIQKNLDDNKLEDINSGIANAENLISKVKDENKRKELTEKLQKIKELINAKKAEIEANNSKPAEDDPAEEKHNLKTKDQRINSPETGFLREDKKKQDEQNNILVLTVLITATITPAIALILKKKKKNPKK